MSSGETELEGGVSGEITTQSTDFQDGTRLLGGRDGRTITPRDGGNPSGVLGSCVCGARSLTQGGGGRKELGEQGADLCH